MGSDTDGYDENASQDACDGHEDAAGEQQDEAGLLKGPQRGIPQHRDRNAHQIDICQDVQDDRDQDVYSGNGRLTAI